MGSGYGCVPVCQCVCVHFVEPEQQIMHVHTCTMAREHLCKHLYHGRKMQLSGQKKNAQQHLERCARGRRGAEGEQAGGLSYVPGHRQLGMGPLVHQAGRATLLRCRKKKRPPHKDVHTPIPGACKDVTLRGLRDFADVIKLRISGRGAHPGLLGRARCHHEGP